MEIVQPVKDIRPGIIIEFDMVNKKTQLTLNNVGPLQAIEAIRAISSFILDANLPVTQF
jgi:hypothetical protein